jgi:hypothetical protein
MLDLSLDSYSKMYCLFQRSQSLSFCGTDSGPLPALRARYVIQTRLFQEFASDSFRCEIFCQACDPWTLIGSSTGAPGPMTLCRRIWHPLIHDLSSMPAWGFSHQTTSRCRRFTMKMFEAIQYVLYYCSIWSHWCRLSQASCFVSRRIPVLSSVLHLIDFFLFSVCLLEGNLAIMTIPCGESLPG